MTLCARDEEIMEAVGKAKGGLVGLSHDRETFFAVKRLERAGKLKFCGRDTGRIMVCAKSESEVKR